MRGVAAEHRPAARLRHVADEDAGITGGLAHARGEAPDEGDKLRVAVEAVAGRPHDLPVRPVERQRAGAGDAAPRIGAVDVRRPGRGLALAAEHLLGRQVRVGEGADRRRRVRLERAAILRRGRAGEHSG